MRIDLTGYVLTFDEEFNNLSISQTGLGTTWADIREGSRMSDVADIGFGSSAFVDPASGINPFGLDDGGLSITAVRAPSTIVGPGDWASGLIHTKASFTQTYGYFEMRADLPEGFGVWPAFWLLRADGTWPPEIDVAETYGTNDLFAGVHSKDPEAYGYGHWSYQPTMTDGFHTYGVLWDQDRITFFFDGTAYAWQPTPADAHEDLYMVIDLAIEGKPGISPDPKTMVIDYVRAYSADEDAEGVPLAELSPPDGADTSDLYGATTDADPIRVVCGLPVAAPLDFEVGI